MTNPKISVIMPAYNGEKYIAKSIQSILDQTFKDFELIIINNGSQDNTESVIKQFSDSRIIYQWINSNKGPGGARDVGLKTAKGEIAVLADSDDFSYPNRLETIENAFDTNRDADVVYGVSEREELDGKKTIRPTNPFNPELLKYYNFISNPASSFKIESYLATPGYDQNLMTSEDYDLWLTFLEHKFKFVFINQPLVLQKIHSESVTSQTEFDERKKNLSNVRQKHHLPVPNPEDVKKLVDQELWKFIFTPKGKEFWFDLRD